MAHSKANIGRTEQLIRILGGTIFMVMGFITWQYVFWPGIIIALVGTAAFVTGLFSFSLFYAIFRINTARPRAGKEDTMAKDPVCGMDVDEKTAPAKSVYKGKTYYFCAPGCKKTFDANPEHYLKKGG